MFTEEVVCHSLKWCNKFHAQEVQGNYRLWQRRLWVDPKLKRQRDDQLQTLVNEVSSIKDSLTDLFALNESSKIPLGLKKVFGETFKCCICHRVPIQPPMSVTKCSKTILGCDTCVNTWFSGLDMFTKLCPACRSERGCNKTIVIRGLDKFLTQMDTVFKTEYGTGVEKQFLHWWRTH